MANNQKFTAPSCVLLDLDNTIYDYAPCHEAGLRSVTQEVCETLSLSASSFESLYKQARLQIKDRLGDIAASHSRLLYFQRALELAGLGSQPLRALTLENIYWRSFLDKAVLFDDVEEFLDDLRIAAVDVVVVTDLTASIQLRKFLHWGLDRYTDWIVTSEENGADKPDRKIFELALAKLGGVEGAVWMVGDNIEKDARGAKEAVGATTFIRTADGAPVDASCVDVGFGAFSELRRYFREALHAPA